MNSDARNLRLCVTRRDEPDMRRLVAWVLGIADTRHRAWVNGEPDPYGLALPDGRSDGTSAPTSPYRSRAWAFGADFSFSTGEQSSFC